MPVSEKPMPSLSAPGLGDVPLHDRLVLMARIRWLAALLALAYAAMLLALDPLHSLRLGISDPAFLLMLPLWMVLYNLVALRLAEHPRGGDPAVAVSLLGDLVATLLAMHGSGGNSSWAWSLYPAVTLEAGYLTQSTSWTIAAAGLGAVFYGLEIELERLGALRVVLVPTLTLVQPLPPAYLGLRLVWVLLMDLGMAVAGLSAMHALAHARAALQRSYVRLEEQYTALGQLDRLKSSFLSTVSHELRTPLTIIQGNTELLEEARELSPQSRVLVTDAERGVQLLTRRVELMLNYTTLASGEAPLQLEPTSAQSILDQVVATCQVASRNAGVVLMLEEQQEPLILSADAARLVQALVQLVDNGVRAAGRGGTVGLTALAEGPHVVFRVWDTGPGLPKTVEQRLGEPFTQAGVDLTDHTPGLGLGLALAQLVAVLHGGSLTSEDTGGRGASLRLAVLRHPGEKGPHPVQ